MAISASLSDARPVQFLIHSHLDCGAYFSEEDAASMTRGGTEPPAHDLAYLVTAVDSGLVTAHKLFIYNPVTRAFAESTFSIDS